MPAGVQLFSLLQSNPDLLDLLVTMLAAAPRLAETIARRAHVMDALLDPAFFGSVPDSDVLRERLAGVAGRGAVLSRTCSTAPASSARSSSS